MAGLKKGVGARGLLPGAEAVQRLMDYRLVPYKESARQTDAIRVAELLGLGRALIKRALLLHDEDLENKKR